MPLDFYPDGRLREVSDYFGLTPGNEVKKHTRLPNSAVTNRTINDIMGDANQPEVSQLASILAEADRIMGASWQATELRKRQSNCQEGTPLVEVYGLKSQYPQ